MVVKKMSYIGRANIKNYKKFIFAILEERSGRSLTNTFPFQQQQFGGQQVKMGHFLHGLPLTAERNMPKHGR